MFSTIINSVKDHFSKRFIFASLLPVLIYIWISFLLYNYINSTLLIFDTIAKQTIEQRVYFLSIFIIGALALAYLLDVFFVNFFQFYEGYWDQIFILKTLQRFRRTVFQKRWEALKIKIDELKRQIQEVDSNNSHNSQSTTINAINYANLNKHEREWLLFYPPKKDLVMPTLLGNMIRSAELYPQYRYGMDVAVIWGRLQHVFPENFSTKAQDVWFSIRLSLNLNILSIISTLLWISFSLMSKQDWKVTFFIVTIGLLISTVTFQAFFKSTQNYCELIKVAFDLYRQELLKSFHLEYPKTLSEEKLLWENITDFIYRNIPPEDSLFRYHGQDN